MPGPSTTPNYDVPVTAPARAPAARSAIAETASQSLSSAILPLALAGLALVGATLVTLHRWGKHTSPPHFGVLAQAFLGGRIDLARNVYDAVVANHERQKSTVE